MPPTAQLASRHLPVPEHIDPQAWLDHMSQFLTSWLDDFTWNARPLAAHLNSVAVEIQGHSRRIWTRPADLDPVRLPGPGSPATAETLDRMLETAWCTEWADLVNEWRLAGTWVHPDVSSSLDQLSWHDRLAVLPIGCLDQADPAAPRRFDPTKMAWANDLGVIEFPVRTYRCLDWLAAGYPPAAAVLLLAGTTVLEAGAHEAMEMYDLRDGRPAWSPHAAPVPVTVTATWATSRIPLETSGPATSRR